MKKMGKAIKEAGTPVLPDPAIATAFNNIRLNPPTLRLEI